MIELAVDVEDGDAHDEHRHEHVQQHADFDQEGVRAATPTPNV